MYVYVKRCAIFGFECTPLNPSFCRLLFSIALIAFQSNQYAMGGVFVV